VAVILELRRIIDISLCLSPVPENAARFLNEDTEMKLQTSLPVLFVARIQFHS
jgi:hypothetical protein